jgi:protein-S-isoprenylcysteine O-methyltransferase Ste14
VTSLELKVPPDAVAAMVAGLMWLASVVTPTVGHVPRGYRVLAAGVLLTLAVLLLLAAKIALARAQTTPDARHPDRTSRLVTTSVYRFTRNPIYVAMMLVLLAWAAALWNPVSLCVSAVFGLYLQQFQIRPEERVLGSVFGQAYADYARRVRRWL